VKSYAARIYSAAVILIAIDQVLKTWVLYQLKDSEPIVLIGPLTDQMIANTLQFVFVANTGAAFGFGSNMTVLISVIAVAVVIGLLRWSRKIGDPIWATATALLLAGAAGNLIDRIIQPPGPLRGYVVDFISIGRFPVFNFADICITFAAITLIFVTLAKRIPEGRNVSE